MSELEAQHIKDHVLDCQIWSDVCKEHPASKRKRRREWKWMTKQLTEVLIEFPPEWFPQPITGVG